jgi:hypothetical protein
MFNLTGQMLLIALQSAIHFALDYYNPMGHSFARYETLSFPHRH